MKLPRLKEWRESRGLMQKEVAADAGVSEYTVLRAEGGISIRPDTARKIAEALNVTVADLLENPPVPLGQASTSSEPAKGAEDSEEQREELRNAEKMFLEAYDLLENLSETYRSAGDEKKLEALGSVAFLSGYGAMQHVEEEADVESIEDQETLTLAVRARNAAVRIFSLAEILDTGGRDEVTSMRRKKAPASTTRDARVYGA